MLALYALHASVVVISGYGLQPRRTDMVQAANAAQPV